MKPLNWKWYRGIRGIISSYRLRKMLHEPDLRAWEFVVQMLVSAYLSWRWIGGKNGRFAFWSLRYWQWVAQYSSLNELATRASLASKRNLEAWRETHKMPEPEPDDDLAPIEYGSIG